MTISSSGLCGGGEKPVTIIRAENKLKVFYSLTRAEHLPLTTGRREIIITLLCHEHFKETEGRLNSRQQAEQQDWELCPRDGLGRGIQPKSIRDSVRSGSLAPMHGTVAPLSERITSSPTVDAYATARFTPYHTGSMNPERSIRQHARDNFLLRGKVKPPLDFFAQEHGATTLVVAVEVDIVFSIIVAQPKSSHNSRLFSPQFVQRRPHYPEFYWQASWTSVNLLMLRDISLRRMWMLYPWTERLQLPKP
ncbi:hypothetical protein CBL_07334 [Carabus blaptoides fortunei]